MKKVVSGNELKLKMEEAVSLLCNTVKTTLGPKGSNVIIDHSLFSPFVTNDGVTIAENIESDDEIINTILELAKEASIRTNETVGDGTTTTLVLLQSIFDNGKKLIEAGVNPIVLKNELMNSLNNIIDSIKEKSKIPTKKELINIAMVSANDENIGKNVSDVYFKVKNKSAINIKEGDSYKTHINYLKGYIISTNLASNYFLKDLYEIKYDDAYILLIDNFLNELEDVVDVINYIIYNKKNLIIIAKDYNELVINEILSLNIDNNINIILLKNPEYGLKEISVLKDLSVISNAKIIEKVEGVSIRDLGKIDNIIINLNETIISFKMNNQISNRIKEIKKEIKSNNDLDFINKRMSMFDNGLANILVGGFTNTERREKKMRYDDSLCAINSASLGVLPGCGLIFLDISDKMVIKNNGDLILKKALISPFEQIIENSGENKKEIYKFIKDNNFKVLYNVNNSLFEKIEETEIIDSTEVVINSLISATSIASILLTTTNIVINEYQNNLNKEIGYNEL